MTRTLRALARCAVGRSRTGKPVEPASPRTTRTRPLPGETTQMPTLTRAKTPAAPRFPPRRSRRSGGFIHGLLAFLAACGDTGDGPDAGARGTLDGPDVIVNAATEEVFAVGSAMGDDWDTFGNVRSVHFDAQANLHVFDSQADHILVVGPDGSLVRTVGGQGEGPGEFGNVLDVIVARDGSYTVMGFGQVDLLDPLGEFVRRVTLDPATTGMVMADLALPDGRLVTDQIVRFGDDDEQPGEEGRAVHIFPLDGADPELLYTAWELPEEEEHESSISSSSSGRVWRLAAGRAFEPRLDYDLLTDGRLALIDSVGYRVKLIGPDGSVTGTIERPIAPLPVDGAIMEAERERYRERTEAVLESGARNDIRVEREGAEERTFAAEVPVLYGLKVDWEDRIWVARRGPTGQDDGPTDIVTPGGNYVGTLPPDGLRTPAAFGPGGLMAYIESDEMDVPTVRVVRLVALEPAG